MHFDYRFPYTPAGAGKQGERSSAAQSSRCEKRTVTRTEPLLVGLSLLAAHLFEELNDLLLFVLGLFLQSGLDAGG